MGINASRIKYIDGIRFKRIMCAAAERVIENSGYLDKINVFPVPDGDTGANMAGTMKSIMEGSKNALDASIESMSKIIAESALLGARGNSGVILAQFFCGFSEGVKDLARITPQDFAKAATKAAERAKESMNSPKEGTILTVITDWADHLKQNVDDYKDFPELLHDSLERAQESLKETTEKLACLKKADVVDAGAQGFVYLLDGISDFVERGKLNRKAEKEILDSDNDDVLGTVQERVAVEDLTFQYCTECLIRGENINRDVIRERLSDLGDSLIVAGTDEVVRIHVHTNEPEVMFGIAEEYGEVSRRKVDDMLKQHRDLVAKARQKVGIVTDSCCDLPDDFMDTHGIRFAPLTLTLDEQDFVDKVEITTSEFNDRLRVSKSAKTSQPSPASFKTAFEQSLGDFQEVVAIQVTAGGSGTFQASKNMARMVDEERITVLDSNTCSVALGLVVREAALAAGLGMDAKEVVKVAEDAIEKVRIFVSLDTLDFAVRGGRLGKGQGAVAKMLNIKPVVTFNREGKCELIAKGFGRAMSQRKLLGNLRDYAENKQNLRFAICHIGAPDKAKRYAKMIWDEFGVEPQYITEASPVLGCYAGLDAVGVAVLGD